MPTFLEVQQRINLDKLNRMDMLPETKRAIQAAIRSYEGQRFWFNETSTIINCVANQSYISFPSDFMMLDELRVTVQSADYRLIQKSLDEIYEINVTRSKSQPDYFCQFGQRFELSPIPDSAYPVIVTYMQKLPTLSADTDTNDWLSAAEDLVVYCAAKMLAADLGNVGEASKFAELEGIFYRQLLRVRDQKTITHIRPTKF